MSEEPNENSRRSFLKSTLLAIPKTTLSSGLRPLLAEEGRGVAAQPVPSRLLRRTCDSARNSKFEFFIIYWTAEALKTRHLKNPGTLGMRL